MLTSINLFIGRIAASCVRSLLAYLSDMFCRSLCGFLRFIPYNKFLEATKWQASKYW